MECPDFPAEHVWREFDFNVSQEKRDADSPEPYPSAERVPSCYLRAGLEDVRELQWYDAENGVVFPVPLGSDGDGYNGGSPVADEAFG